MPSLYRFLSASNALRSIEARKLRLGRIADLNDPFDCSMHIVGMPGKQALLCDTVSDVVNQHRNDELGLLCFTKTWSDPVLWSHYADCHRGCALVFAFPPDRPDLHEVKYRKKRMPLKYEDLIKSHLTDVSRNAFERSLYVKSKTWEYEQEWRMLVNLDRCEIEAGSYFLNFDESVFRGIVLGLKCSANAADIRRIYRKAGFPNAVIWRTRKSIDGFSLRRERA